MRLETDHDSDPTTECEHVALVHINHIESDWNVFKYSSEFICTYNTVDHDLDALTPCVNCPAGFHSNLMAVDCSPIACSYAVSDGGNGPLSSSPLHSSTVCDGFTGDICPFTCGPGYSPSYLSGGPNHTCTAFSILYPLAPSTIGLPTVWHGHFDGGECLAQPCIGDIPLVGCTPGIHQLPSWKRVNSMGITISRKRNLCRLRTLVPLMFLEV